MSSLLEISIKDLIPRIIRNEINVDSLEKLQTDILIKLIGQLTQKVVKTKKKSVDWFFSEEGGIEEQLKKIEKAHKYGFCQEIYRGVCHICNDCCIECEGNFDPDDPNWRCLICFLQKTKKQIRELKQIKNVCVNSIEVCNPEDCTTHKIEYLEQIYKEHEQFICNCSPEYHDCL